MKQVAIALVAAALGSTTALSQETDFERGNMIITVGAANLSEGEPNRKHAGIQGNFYLKGGFGLHVDLSGVDSDLEATSYGALGFSQEVSEGLTAKFTLGGSTSRFGYYPKLRVQGEVTKDFGTERGLVLRGSMAFAEFDNDAKIAELGAHIVHYSPPMSNDGYFVKQADLTVTKLLDSASVGWDASAGLVYVDKAGWSAGLSAATGLIAYDQQIGTTIENNFWAVRPSLGYRISDKAELFARGEYVDTELYNVMAASVGLNVELQ